MQSKTYYTVYCQLREVGEIGEVGEEIATAIFKNEDDAKKHCEISRNTDIFVDYQIFYRRCTVN